LRMAGALTLVIFGDRPLRTSWLMVGTRNGLLVGDGDEARSVDPGLRTFGR
jgi:hypothetical protein